MRNWDAMSTGSTWSRHRPLAVAAVAVAVIAPLYPLAMASSYRLIDLNVYIGAAEALLRNGNLYDFTTERGYYFTYPPFAALAMAPLGLLPRDLVYGAWVASTLPLLAITVAAAGGSIAAVWASRVGIRRRTLLAGAFVALAWTVPVWINMRYGQISLLLMAMVVVDFLWLKGKRPHGVLIGVAAAIKLTPALFVVHFLLTRQWRAMVTAVATFVSAQLIALLVIPTDTWRFWTDAVFDNSRYGDNVDGNRSIRGMLERVDAPVLLVVAAVVLVTAIGLWRARSAEFAGEPVTVVAILGALSICVAPVGWQHHMTWLLVAVIVLAGTPRRLWLAVVLTALLMVDLNEVGAAALDSMLWGAPLWYLVMAVHGLVAVAVVVALPIGKQITSYIATPGRTEAGYRSDTCLVSQPPASSTHLRVEDRRQLGRR